MAANVVVLLDPRNRLVRADPDAAIEDPQSVNLHQTLIRSRTGRSLRTQNPAFTTFIFSNVQVRKYYLDLQY